MNLLCAQCGSEQLIRDGKTAGGKQRFRCRSCGRRSNAEPYQSRLPALEGQVLALLNERTSQRGIARALKISRVTVAQILKKTLSN